MTDVVNDVWFSFNAPTSGNVVIKDGDNAYYSIYDGACGNLTELFCYRIQTSDRQFSGLASGQQYFLRVSKSESYDSFTFDIREGAAPPVNDECSGAIVLSVGSGTCGPSVSLNYEGATDSGLPDPECSTYFQDDIWYSFVAPPSGSIRFDNISKTKEVYSGLCGLSLIHI